MSDLMTPIVDSNEACLAQDLMISEFFCTTCSETVVDSMVVTTELLRKSTMEVPRKKEATVSEENTMTTHAACGEKKDVTR